MKSVDKKLVLVTGGIRGIGAAIATALQGYNGAYTVISNYVANDAAAERFAAENKILIKKWNVSNYAACKTAIQEIEAQHGRHVDILINNAGITNDKMFHKMSEEDWLNVINTNLLSCFNMCHVVINKMRDNNYGRIINLSSVNAQVGQIGQTNYCAAKAGIIGFTKTLARESASKNITVNCIAPGYIATDMVAKIPQNIIDNIIQQIPVRRLGLPDDIARIALFLADEKSSFITGATLSVNGGYNMA